MAQFGGGGALPRAQTTASATVMSCQTCHVSQRIQQDVRTQSGSTSGGAISTRTQAATISQSAESRRRFEMRRATNLSRTKTVGMKANTTEQASRAICPVLTHGIRIMLVVGSSLVSLHRRVVGMGSSEGILVSEWVPFSKSKSKSKSPWAPGDRAGLGLRLHRAKNSENKQNQRRKLCKAERHQRFCTFLEDRERERGRFGGAGAGVRGNRAMVERRYYLSPCGPADGADDSRARRSIASFPWGAKALRSGLGWAWAGCSPQAAIVTRKDPHDPRRGPPKSCQSCHQQSTCKVQSTSLHWNLQPAPHRIPPPTHPIPRPNPLSGRNTMTCIREKGTPPPPQRLSPVTQRTRGAALPLSPPRPLSILFR